MARRKRVLDDGDDSDSVDGSDNPDFDFDNDPDAREERALFENPYGHKRRRKNGKEDALYGIFAEDSDEDGGGKRGLDSKSKRSDWTKAPAFVTGDKPVKLDEPMAVDSDDAIEEEESSDNSDDDGEDVGSEGENERPEDAGYSDESESSRPPSPRVRNEDEDEVLESKPRVGGIGSKTNDASSSHASFSKGGIGTLRTESTPSFAGMSKGGIGSSRSESTPLLSGMPKGGIGSKTAGAPTEEISFANDTPSMFNMPSAFGQKSQSFNRSTSSTPKPSALPAEELAHFNKIQNTFGARMLAKMGWQAGTGLGADGTGIAIPIESKLRPQKMGIAFKGWKEKTEQSKLEAKRRGEVVSDDEDPKTRKFKKKAKEQQEKRADAWKRPKKVKTKIEHKTYEQILAEAGEEVAPVGIGQIIDATGAVVCYSETYSLTLNSNCQP